MTADASGSEKPSSQRLDKWLWFARLAKSRTIAATAVTEGKIKLNRVRVEKPSQPVKVGDVITSRMQRAIRVVQVVDCGVRRGPAAEAQKLYLDLTPPPAPPSERPIAQSAGEREAGTGRPTKRDRRLIDALKAGK